MCALSAQQNAIKYISSYLIFFVPGIYYGEQRMFVHVTINTLYLLLIQTYLRSITTNDWKHTVKTVFQNKKVMKWFSRNKAMILYISSLCQLIKEGGDE